VEVHAQALVGRTFLPGEDLAGHTQVVVLDYGFWMRRFAGDRSLIGRAVTLDKQDYLVVGVMPKDFLPLGKGWGDVYMPWVIAANEMTGFEVVARLRRGVTIERARSAIEVIQTRLANAEPADYKGVTIGIETLQETIVGNSRQLLRLLLAGAALVLLIACANVANLFLARGAARRRETEIRAFLGANRRQLIAPTLAESALVAAIGGGLGLLAAWGIARAIAARLENFPRAEEIAVDGRVALVALAAVVFTTVVCGIAPAFSFKRRRRTGMLVIVEVALTFVLLIGAGLLIRSFAAMRQVDLGYDPSGVILGFVAQPEDPQNRREGAIALWRRVRERIAGLPNVAAVATSTGTPTGGIPFRCQMGNDIFLPSGQVFSKTEDPGLQIPLNAANFTLPAINSRYSRAAAICPGWPRTSWMRSSKGASLPFNASTDMAPATRAAANTSSAPNNPASASAVETCVPLIRARPSLARSLRGSNPAKRKPSLAGSSVPRTRTSPMPSNTVLRCAKGARSPEAPTEPCAGITGYTSCCSNASKASITAMVMPECPRASALILRTRIKRTTASGSASPTPAACESSRLRCRSSSCW
jgi:hypothetical protein